MPNDVEPRRLLVPGLLAVLIVSAIANAATGPAPTRTPDGPTYCDADGCAIGAANLTYLNASTVNVSSTLRLPDGHPLDSRTTRTLTLSATAVRSSGSVDANRDHTKLNHNFSLLSANATENFGWQATAPAWVDVRLPFGVVVGDSIALGRPHMYGRLQGCQGCTVYDPHFVSGDGQLSYELGIATGLFWFNHGIGSENSNMIWARWKRDVLAETYDPSDGRGSSTLPEKPRVVVVSAGQNDATHTTNSLPLATTKANLILMAQSLRDNGITGIFLTPGPHETANTTALQQLRDTADWMKATLPSHGVYVVDFLTWAEGSVGSARPATGLYTDVVHPSKGGYKALARHLLESVDGAPIYLHGLVIEAANNPSNPAVNFARARNVTVNTSLSTTHYTLENLAQLFLPLKSLGDRETTRITINSIQGGVVSTSGFSAIRAVLSDTPRDAAAWRPDHFDLNDDTRLRWSDVEVHRWGTTTVGITGALTVERASASNNGLSTRVAGDSVGRWQVYANGTHDWGPGGSTTRDTHLSRPGASVLSVGADDALRLGDYAGTCEATTEGAIRYTTGSPGAFQGCRRAADGTSYEWTTLS